MPISDIITPNSIRPVSETQSGLMTPQDKTKLDSINVATVNSPGMVKPDGITTTVDENGVITSLGGGSAPLWREATI